MVKQVGEKVADGHCGQLDTVFALGVEVPDEVGAPVTGQSCLSVRSDLHVQKALDNLVEADLQLLSFLQD